MSRKYLDRIMGRPVAALARRAWRAREIFPTPGVRNFLNFFRKHRRKGSCPPVRLRRAEGFSLLEVLVATTLMGLVLVVLLEVMTSAIWAQEAAWGHTQALVVAERILQETSEAAPLTAANYQGKEGRYDYLVRVTPQYEVSSPFVDRRVICSLVQIAVSWRERGRVKSVELQTMKTSPLKK